MNILLDHCVPRPLKKHLLDLGAVSHTSETGWGKLTNGELLREAQEVFDVFLIVDKGQRFQQDISSISLGFVVIRVFRNSLPEIEKHLPEIRQPILDAQYGKAILLGEPRLLR
ncbi:MAG: hypothetical protein SF339_10960 [Blastocatellia bacterium]|nr:hypothetical protein [Blastocatellia bacterium]